MTRRQPDPAALDAMVLGTDGDEHLDDWRDLLASPDADAVWQAAVERREKIDAVARALRAAPWMAPIVLHMRRAMRRRPLASLGVGLRFGSPLAATLAEEGRIEVTPGAVVVLDVPIGRDVSIELPTGATLRRETSSGSEAFPYAGWAMERGDGVVVLAVVGADARTVATIVLREVASGENGAV